jgi:peroxiredoxin (alkyl hydroperoxide reductase subunit C)
MIKIGEKVPEFEAKAFHNGNETNVKLTNYKGKWVVLLFYPADFTFICPTELEEAAILYPEFQKENAEILSVSTDSVFVHKAWHDTSEAIKKIKFPMLADTNGGICKIFGTLMEDGLSLRASLIIDPDGVLKYIEMHHNDIGRNSNETLRKLQAAKFVYENGGVEVCPASWSPGKKTIKPGMDLVGKI